MRELTYRQWIARGIARAMLADASAGNATAPHALRSRALAALGGDHAPWLPALVKGLGGMTASIWQRTDLPALTERIAALPAFDLAFADGKVPRIRRLILRHPAMLPPPLGLDTCELPVLATPGDLAVWLGMEIDRLAWLTSDAQRLRPNNQRPHAQAASHYRCLLQAKRRGGLRLIEAPKADLKLAQRLVLDGLLNHVPVHEAAHGFVAGRSVASHAAAHVGQPVVVRFDLKDFFPSIRASRVHAMWRTLGYPEGVARSLTALCSTRTPAAVIERLRDDGGVDWMGAKRLAAAHLPQGAPTSPALANLCAFRLDLRLAGLAWVFGATYTRYADDLVFSGPATLRHRLPALQAWTAGIAADEGFVLHPRKTRCMPSHRQQRITGVVVNQKLNTPRRDFDRLKARLHQCVLRGPASQNLDGIEDFRAHLQGQIAWVGQLNPARAGKLMRLFEKVDWPAQP
jgi:RNA-directed DNA polymerase